MLSEALAERLTAVGFDLNWLHPDASDWPSALLRQERAS
jgi:pilus assembly protein CpaF